MRKWLIGIGVITIVVVLYIVIDELDTRTYELRNRYYELAQKHNQLVSVVKKMHEDNLKWKKRCRARCS